MKLDIKPASHYPTPDLVQLVNLSFKGYIVPIHFDQSRFLSFLHKDAVDLDASLVLLVDDLPVGIALIACRGESSRVAAMGIVTEMRGKRAGSWLMEKVLDGARMRKDMDITLEVIEQNQPAVRLYQKYGFQTIRRLIGLTHQGNKQDVVVNGLEDVSIPEMGRLVSQYGLPDLPWQVSGETIALLTPPARAYQKDGAYITLSNPEAENVVIWSLLVMPEKRTEGRAVDLLNSVIVKHGGRKWQVPAILPEELGGIFERAGFVRDALSQWQMKLSL